MLPSVVRYPDMSTDAPRILIVSAALPGLWHLFERRGFLPEVATTAEAALALLAAKPFDLILLHPIYPLEDGFQLLGRMRATINSATPVYLLVSNDQEDDMECARKLGFWRFAFMQDTSPKDMVEDVWRSWHDLSAGR